MKIGEEWEAVNLKAGQLLQVRKGIVLVATSAVVDDFDAISLEEEDSIKAEEDMVIFLKSGIRKNDVYSYDYISFYAVV